MQQQATGHLCTHWVKDINIKPVCMMSCCIHIIIGPSPKTRSLRRARYSSVVMVEAVCGWQSTKMYTDMTHHGRQAKIRGHAQHAANECDASSHTTQLSCMVMYMEKLTTPGGASDMLEHWNLQQDRAVPWYCIQTSRYRIQNASTTNIPTL
jgi:hypothetical protein